MAGIKLFSKDAVLAAVVGLVAGVPPYIALFWPSGDKTPQVVTYKVEYRNAGSTQQDNVQISVAIPSGSEYIMGSAFISNSVTQGQWQHTNDGITSLGLNIGSYTPGGNAYLKFQVRPRGKVTFTCSSNGDVGGVTVSGDKKVTVWVTC